MNARTFLAFPILAIVATLVAGCSQPVPVGPVPGSETAGGHLSATLRTSTIAATVGDEIALTLTVANTGDEPLQIEATTAAPMIVTVWRHDRVVGWRRLREYPGVSVRIRNSWQLEPGEPKTLTMTVPVETDWPVLETLKISAELNGRTDTRPFVLVEIVPKSTAAPSVESPDRS